MTERKAHWAATREHGTSTDAAGVSKVSSHLTSGQRALIEAELVRRQHELDRQVAEHQGGLSRSEHAHEILAQDSDDISHREADPELDMTITDRAGHVRQRTLQGRSNTANKGPSATSERHTATEHLVPVFDNQR